MRQRGLEGRNVGRNKGVSDLGKTHTLAQGYRALWWPLGSSKGWLEKKYLTLVVSVCVYVVCMGVCAWVCICVHSVRAWGACVCA